MNRYLFFFLIASYALQAQDNPQALLEKSITYHDPQGQWSSLQATFYYTETRPDGPDRKITFRLDNSQSKWRLNRNDDEIYEVEHDRAKVISGERDEARGLMLRNYYLYLWGLPMKLKDESTPGITRLEDTRLDGVAAYVLRVAYEKETYYFSFDQTSGRMIEYRFYKDEAAGKGELITLEDEVVFEGIRIPKKRSWYTLPEMKYLGTDILDRVE